MPAYGYSQNDLRRWIETGIDPHEDFALRNDPPKLPPAKFETVKGQQRDLFVGLDDLPGQMLLIDEVNTD